MDRVVVGDESAFGLRRADRDDASHGQTGQHVDAGGVRMAWAACEKMSYEREAWVLVPLSVTSSDPYRIGLHAVRPPGETCTPTRWAGHADVREARAH
jgi:hypothetical protein